MVWTNSFCIIRAGYIRERAERGLTSWNFLRRAQKESDGSRLKTSPKTTTIFHTKYQPSPVLRLYFTERNTLLPRPESFDGSAGRLLLSLAKRSESLRRSGNE